MFAIIMNMSVLSFISVYWLHRKHKYQNDYFSMYLKNINDKYKYFENINNFDCF